MHVVWMRYNDELGPSFTLWDKTQNCKSFCQNDADMCRRLSNYFFSKIENSRTKLKKEQSGNWTLATPLLFQRYSPDGLIHAGRAIDNLDTSYSLAKILCFLATMEVTQTKLQ